MYQMGWKEDRSGGVSVLRGESWDKTMLECAWVDDSESDEGKG